MRNNLSGSYYLTNDIDCSSFGNFSPLTSSLSPFSGTFDGNNYKISNLSINTMMSNSITGIFGSISGAEIKNVGIVDANIVGLNQAAALAQSVVDSVIYNVYVTGKMTSTLSAAGLAMSVTNSEIIDCYSTALIDGDGAIIGGLVGSASGSTAVSSYWDIETSGQTTSALGEGKTTDEMKQQSTFIGWGFDDSLWCIRENVTYPKFCKSFSWVSISTCNDLQNIKNNLSGNYQLAQDIDCNGFNFTPIGATGFANPFTGYLDGKNYKIKNLTLGSISNKTWTGLFRTTMSATIQNVHFENINITGGRPIGTIAAYAHKTAITNCSASGTINAPNFSEPYDSILAGGIVGQLIGKGSISNSFSSVNITSIGTAVGGIAATVSEESSVINSYATGSVTSSSGGVGGLVASLSSLGHVENSYSTGKVSGTSSVGGLIGSKSDDATVVSSYWNTETSEIDISAGGEPKTTVEMKHQDTFAGWDFENVWCITECTTYPLFKGNCAANVCSGCAVLNGNKCVPGDSCSGESTTCSVSCNVGICGCTSDSCDAGKKCISGICVNCDSTEGCGGCSCGTSEKPTGTGSCLGNKTCCPGECNSVTGANSCSYSDALCPDVNCNRQTLACCTSSLPYWRSNACRSCSSTSGHSGTCVENGMECDRSYNCVACEVNTKCTCDDGEVADGLGNCIVPDCTSDSDCGLDQCIYAGNYDAFCSGCSTYNKIWYQGSCTGCPADATFVNGVCVCSDSKVWNRSINSCINKGLINSSGDLIELRRNNSNSAAGRYDRIKNRMNRIKTKIGGGAGDKSIEQD